MFELFVIIQELVSSWSCINWRAISADVMGNIVFYRMATKVWFENNLIFNNKGVACFGRKRWTRRVHMRQCSLKSKFGYGVEKTAVYHVC